MTAFQGASSHPLVSQWVAWLQDQQWIIPQEATTLAARGEWLGCNDPFIAALYAAHLQGLMGPLGPRLSSQCDANPGEAATSDATRAIRRRITAMAAATWALMTGKSGSPDTSASSRPPVNQPQVTPFADSSSPMVGTLCGG